MDDAQGFVAGLKQSLGGLQDPRVTGRCDHLLFDIIAIAVLSTFCGADEWADRVAGALRKAEAPVECQRPLEPDDQSVTVACVAAHRIAWGLHVPVAQDGPTDLLGWVAKRQDVGIMCSRTVRSVSGAIGSRGRCILCLAAPS